MVRRQGATLFMGLLAAFQLLLSRYSGQKDICVGTPVANRHPIETEAMIGCFVNMLVLRTGLAGNPRFSELLALVRERVLEAQEHQDLPFEQLVTELNVTRELGHNPLFQVSFALDNTPAPEAEAAGLVIKGIDLETATSMFDLSVDVAEAKDGLEIKFEYSTGLFLRSTIERLAVHYAVFLDSITLEPDARISDLPMLTEAERKQLIGAGNGDVLAVEPLLPARPAATVVDLAEESAKRLPERLALIQGERRLTYRELNIRANRLAHHLLSLGAGPETVVGVYAGRSIELTVAALAILKAGAAYMPLDPAYPAARLRQMLEESAPALLLSQGPLPGDLTGAFPVLGLQSSVHSGYPDTNPGVAILPDSLAYILFTSGSTGRPKGIMATHDALANRANWGLKEFGLGPSDVVLARTSPSFDVSLWEIFGALASGACLAIAGTKESGPEQILELIIRHSVTFIEAVPSLLRAMMRLPHWQECKSLRTVCCGGEAMSHALCAEFAETASNCRLYNMYGPAEAAVDCAFFSCSPSQEDCDAGATVPIGRPLQGARLYLLDGDLNLAPLGCDGELYIGGRGLARGYLNNAALTAGRFIPNPFEENGGRLYRTGDLARWHGGGMLEFRGRIDRQVKLRGYRIELEEIEARLAELPGVAAAAVFLQTDRSGNSKLIAYVAARDETITPALLRRHARSVLPHFMVPSAFMLMPELPYDENGKLRYASLPAVLPPAGGEAESSPIGSSAYNAPANGTELTIARLFAEVLELPAAGRHDSFFELGGHSLLAVELALRLREELKADIPLVALFQHPTAAGLAQWLHSEKDVSASPLVTMRAGTASRPELYLLHTGTGHVRGYQPLVGALGDRGPILGVNLPALHDPAMAARDFAEITEDYARTLLSCHQGGPFCLLGWSLGGLLALGVAARLQALGANVGFLGLIDADPPEKLAVHDWKGRLSSYLPGPEERAVLAGLPARDLLELEQLLASVALQERPASAALWGHEKGLWFQQLPASVLRLETSLWRHLDAIEDSFEAPRFTGKIHLWRASGSLGKDGIPGVDWAKLTGAETYEKIIDGDHGTVIASPELHASIWGILTALDG